MSIFGELKDIASVFQKAGKIEEYRQITDIQAQLLEIQEENQRLKEENKKLQELLDLKGKLAHRNNMYFLGDDTQKPFCSRCWDSDKKLINLTFHENGALDCPDCKVLAKPGRAHVHIPNHFRNSAR